MKRWFSMFRASDVYRWAFFLLTIDLSVGRRRNLIVVDTASEEYGSVQLDEPMLNITSKRGATIKWNCEITGDPRPTYFWSKNGVPVENVKRRVSIKPHLYGCRLRITGVTKSDAGNYTCYAENKYGHNQTWGLLTVLREWESPKTVPINTSRGTSPSEPSTGTDGKAPIPALEEGYCQPVNVYACKQFIGNRTVFVRSNTDQTRFEQNNIAMLSSLVQSTISLECQQALSYAICFNSLPVCDKSDPSKPRPLRICQADCVALSRKCQSQLDSVPGRSLDAIKDALPRCKELPADSHEQSSNCIHLRDTTIKDERECYQGRGDQYTGHATTTKSGRACRMWTDVNPQAALQASQGLGAHKYCRNPNSEREAPWCYTGSGPGADWDFCSLPKCEASEGSPAIKDVMLILIPSIAIPLALALLLTIFCLCRRRQQSRRRDSASPVKVNGAPHSARATAVELTPLTNGLARAPEFPLHGVRFIQEFGEGNFGQVWLAEAQGPGMPNPTRVVVKTLREGAPPRIQNDFRREVDILTDLRHPHVVSLVGVCMKDQPWSMLLEYPLAGDMHEWLLREQNVLDTDSSAGPEVLHRHLVGLCAQISSGMEYLVSRRFVHRDLAARNILLSPQLTAKISDISLVRQKYSSDYFRFHQNLLPVRWMSPEAIMHGRYTHQSDVWSFGVLMWEAFSFGIRPFFGYTNADVVEIIRQRQILPCPEDCPARMYALMMECWHEIAMRRPPFRDLTERLRMWQREGLGGPVVQMNTSQDRGLGGSGSKHSHSSESTGLMSMPPKNGGIGQGMTPHPHAFPTPPQSKNGPPSYAITSNPNHPGFHYGHPPPNGIHHEQYNLYPDLQGPQARTSADSQPLNNGLPREQGAYKPSPPASFSSGGHSSGSSAANTRPQQHLPAVKVAATRPLPGVASTATNGQALTGPLGHGVVTSEL